MPDPRDLCSVADVKAEHRTVGDTAAYDALIERLITAASVAIANWTRREFAPQTAGASRRLALTGDGLVLLEPYDLRAVTAITHGEDPVVTVPPDQYETSSALGPEGVYSYLQLAGAGWRPPRPGWVTVTGDWGWPAVPLDVAEACVATVADWLTAAQAGQGPAPELLEAGPAPSRALPPKARWLLEYPYRRRVLFA